MGNLFERGLDPDQRAQLGAHYTSEEDIKTLVEPVLMAPLRREWSQIKSELASAFLRGESKAVDRAKLTTFHNKLAAIAVLDPACGSGNFLYVSLQLLLDLEKELITFATQLGFKFELRVNVRQLKAIELNAYAFELAQVAVQIGYLKWRRDNGFPNEREPVLQDLENFQNEDALLIPHFRSKAKSLKDAQAGEHAADDALKFYTEREWPKCDVIVSNPPFLGDKLMRRKLTDFYVEHLREIYGDRLAGQCDLCCYWFEKARDLIERKSCKRAGLLGTQNIRGGASRSVLDRIKQSGDIFFAVSDRDWILDGANVHVSIVGFDDGTESHRTADDYTVSVINANLTSAVDVTKALRLAANESIAFIGSCKGGPFDVTNAEALLLLQTGGNPHQSPNSDVLRPVMNSEEVYGRGDDRWIIDNASLDLNSAALYEAPHHIVVTRVKPKRDVNRDKWLRTNWWRPQRMRPEMRHAIAKLERFIVTATTSKHRIFRWLFPPTLPDHKLVVVARDDDYFFGVLHSRLHEVWAQNIGTQLRERESGLNYNVQSSFETFPLPKPNEQQKSDIAAAAKELNELRENWLNPPEWTTTRILEFSGSIDGPWSRYLDGGIVRYPRIEPRDEDCTKKLTKRTLTNLYNERPAWLAHAHKKLDAAVAAAYGWSDLIEILERGGTGEIYDFKTGNYGQVNVGPDGLEPILNQLGEQVNEQILERLLALNQQCAAVEKKSSTAFRKRTSRPRTSEEMI